MSTGAKAHFKLGLFTLVAIAAAFATALVLGARSLREDSFSYHTYFDESVQGLEVGAPVKYRGVGVGAVSKIGIAPDKRHVDVVYTLRIPELARLGLVERESDTEFPIPEDLRAQIGTQGITGVKLVDLDFFDSKTAPPPALPFEVAPRTIPAAPSLFKNLEASLTEAVKALPAVLDAATTAIERVDALLAELQDREVPSRVARVLDDAKGAIADVRVVLRHVDQAKIPASLVHTLEALQRSLAKMDSVLARVDGDQGLVESSKRATDAVGDLGREATTSAEDLSRTLRDVSEAAQSLRDLSEALGRDPDMLLKGRAAEAPR
jgi:ABC-type transporter Mla subunit MlaD